MAWGSEKQLAITQMIMMQIPPFTMDMRGLRGCMITCREQPILRIYNDFNWQKQAASFRRKEGIFVLSMSRSKHFMLITEKEANSVCAFQDSKECSAWMLRVAQVESQEAVLACTIRSAKCLLISTDKGSNTDGSHGAHNIWHLVDSQDAVTRCLRTMAECNLWPT